MPRPVLKGMRLTIRILDAMARRWEDRNDGPTDYRMSQVTGSLWQASQSLKEIIDGDYRPGHKAVWLFATVPVPVPVPISERYVSELLADAPIPMTVND